MVFQKKHNETWYVEASAVRSGKENKKKRGRAWFLVGVRDSFGLSRPGVLDSKTVLAPPPLAYTLTARGFYKI